MSSLKDIMDVDVEPLQSQAAYRRSREAAQQASRSSIATSSEVPSPPTDDEDIDLDNPNKGKHPIKRRRSRPAASGTEEASRSDTQDQRESATAGQDMDYQTSYQAMGSGPASGSGTPQNMSRSSESGSSIPVKYTPVTGRISRAKKGVPVHTCETCIPAKTFTRAEHLRRHQLSHQKPAYECTFESCERAFHRPDLLARHMDRHETQGKEAYVSGDRSREASSHSDMSSQPLAIKAERFDNNPGSPDALTPRTASSMGNMSNTTITQQSLYPNYSPGGAGSKRTAEQANLPDMYPVTSPGSNRPHSSFDILSGPVFTAADLPVRGNFPVAELVYEETYTGGEAFPTNYTTSGSPLNNSRLPLLRIPDEPCPTTNAYGHDNSPFCSSSASDSTFSNQSEGPLSTRWGRPRSGSGADWPISATSAWSPQLTTPQDLSSPPFEFIEQFEPHMSVPRSHVQQHLDVPPYGGYFLESVGTPTLSTNSKPISQVFPGSTSRVPTSRLVGTNASREKLETINFSSTAIPFQPSQNLSLYIDTYWQKFHPRFPIIHRPTHDSAEGSLLTTAMAAIGTQYHHTREARIKGSELNESCRKGLDQCPNWTLETMQAILLTEIFSRFRGRKTTIRLSRRFEDLCSRVLHGTDSSYGAPACSSPVDGASVSNLRERFSLLEENQSLQRSTPPNEWRRWIKTESRQRLLNACFMFDVHQALYHQLPRSKALGTELRPFLVSPTPDTDSLWGAADASKWQSQQSLQLLRRDSTGQQLSTESSSFSQSLLICSLATQLPLDDLPSFPRFFHSPPAEVDIASTFTSSPLAQTYLALHHTHLHDLLAVAADTWIFSQKVTPPQAFRDAQKRLFAWSKSMDAAHAVHHACRVLSLTLAQSQKHSSSYHTNSLACVTEYWSLYVSALICWAFGHRYQPNNGKTSNVARANPSTTLGTDVTIVSAQGKSFEEVQAQANFYVTSMLEFRVEELSSSRNTIRSETSGVIDVVRQRLNFEGVNIGGRCSILSDCIGVLQKISKSGNSRWF
ncbi:hypothetical protein BJ875DRAFT_481202 [Amylocarpus encephaloides]|uniref:C2H2-type domain-containing protein n=1 Tax=Amylocarpus encephaloides TaxID=45428 RepID=A0A9P7YPY9_9HELO|nr:hypothetical protein BJ875DRAFT_481202 [Amylocarpus encephaloides]